MPLPESVTLKILRAKEHYEVFVREMHGNFQSHAGELSMEVFGDNQKGSSATITRGSFHPDAVLVSEEAGGGEAPTAWDGKSAVNPGVWGEAPSQALRPHPCWSGSVHPRQVLSE